MLVFARYRGADNRTVVGSREKIDNRRQLHSTWLLRAPSVGKTYFPATDDLTMHSLKSTHSTLDLDEIYEGKGTLAIIVDVFDGTKVAEHLVQVALGGAVTSPNPQVSRWL